MPESDGEQAARSVALEQAYVHDVYEQCAEKTAQSRHWPRIYQFLEELEPGALVCDIGCGNGKYLSVNQSIFKVGADRCKRLTDIAREKENEVLICDNLALPFRDESFDAVLSIAVVHHFATTERRVRALKELARVLRIGGRLVISVWAMEQRHRKFESQDVLVPWPKTYCLSSSSNVTRPSEIPCGNEARHDQVTRKDLSTSKRASQRKCRSKSYRIDPIFSPSPSTSSLSSPNETCYSFFRRALQKLAGGKRRPGNRPWFLETWHNGTGKERRRIEHDDSADVDDLPIELRRLEDIGVTINKFPDTTSVKSKSLGDILEIQRLDLVRSRSSIPGLCSTLTSDLFLDEQTKTPPLSNSKPKLVKQKTHFVDDICLEMPGNTAIQELIKDLPDFQIAPNLSAKRTNVYKQSSMNEELMSMERLKEKERVRQNITKQASLNEEIICKRKAFDTFKDSLYSGNATKRFQLLKSGLTNKIKRSTTNIEKVSGTSIKNGFVRMLQGWKSGESQIDGTTTASIVNCEFVSAKAKATDKAVPTISKRDVDCIERRLSREDGSDSSKDSSLQSDTSVDSEDSFASVIYVPKQDVVPPFIDVASAPPGYQSSATSAPPSPRVKHPPDLTGQRLKFIPISPLLKQFPATSKSLPPPSPPPGSSPRSFGSVPNRPFLGSSSNSQQTSAFDESIDGNERLEDSASESNNHDVDPQSSRDDGTRDFYDKIKITKRESSSEIISTNDDEYSVSTAKAMNMDESLSTEDNVTHGPILDDALRSVRDGSMEKSRVESSSSSSTNEEENRRVRLNQIKESLRQKPGFATRCSKPSFPLVRRASAATPGRLETVARPLPRLLSLELFNPETDDSDSDSSGVSSPESVGSVISVISDERFTTEKGNVKSNESEADAPDCANNRVTRCPVVHGSDLARPDGVAYDLLASRSSSSSSTKVSLASSQSLGLLEAAANVASSPEDAVETVIRVKMCSAHVQRQASTEDRCGGKNSWTTSASPTELQELLPSDSKRTSRCTSPDGRSRNEERRRQHLIDSTEKLSESPIRDIDRYRRKTELEFTKDFFDDDRKDPFKLNRESKITNTYAVPPTSRRLYREVPSTGVTESLDTIARLNGSASGNGNTSENDNEPSDSLLGLVECSNAGLSSRNVIDNVLAYRGTPEDIMDFALVSNNGEFVNEDENEAEGNGSDDGWCSIETILHSDDTSRSEVTSANATKESYSRFGSSTENTMSDGSRTESLRESVTVERNLCNGSTASLGTDGVECKDTSGKQRLQGQVRSASEEITLRTSATKQRASINSECSVNPVANGTLSGSSSQESLPSDRGGGAITYHRYYHVFREGELDQLINKYVENLHIISSYYDHASWCIVAEKVQVWTI